MNKQIPAKRSKPRRPAGVTAIGLLFAFGTVMSGLAAASLVSPSALLESLWQFKPAARSALQQMGLWAPLLFGVVCIACAAAAFGFFAGTRWGYRLGFGILLTNLAGDVVNTVTGIEPMAWIGIPIVFLLLRYISARKVRAFFSVIPSKARITRPM